MASELADLDQLQADYKTAVDSWVAAIRDEEQLASVDHTVAEVDQWEESCSIQNELGKRAEAAKKRYEDALREKFFSF